MDFYMTINIMKAKITILFLLLSLISCGQRELLLQQIDVPTTTLTYATAGTDYCEVDLSGVVNTGIDVTERGFVFGTAIDPTISNGKIVVGSGIGSFTDSYTGLLSNTSYYFRAFGTNISGTGYSLNGSFLTKARPTAIAYVKDVTSSSATIYGTLTENGNDVIGVICNYGYSTFTQVSSSSGAGGGAFSIELTGLTSGQNYYFQVAADLAECSVWYNSTGDGNFTTGANVAPTVIACTTASNITTTSADVCGQVTSEGSATLDVYGVAYAETSNPTIGDNYVYGTGDAFSGFVGEITGLTDATTYHYRTFASNSVGISYSSDYTFTTGNNIVAPTITTNSVTSIASTTATCGGNVTNDGGSSVTARGVCWNTSGTPTTSDSKTTNDTGTGSFPSYITGLTTAVIYYVRAYATNSAGTSYGSEVSFRTNGVPAVTTAVPTNIIATTATVGGEVTHAGGGTVSSRGTVWSENATPTGFREGDYIFNQGTGIGVFSGTVGASPSTPLPMSTLIYIRAYAQNEYGTTYGTERSFTTESCIPILTTSAATNITSTSVTFGGEITDDNGYSITSRGVCYATTTNPDVFDNVLSLGTGTGVFSGSVIDLLEPNTTYYARAYGENSCGLSYGNQISFTTEISSTCDLTTGLIFVWELDETSGTTVNDAVSTNDGVIYPTITLNQTGKLDASYLFSTADGATAYIQNKGNTELSFAMWVNLIYDSGGDYERIFGTEGASIDVAVDRSGYIRVYDNSSWYTTIAQITNGVWTHVAVSRTQNGWNIYLNGELAASRTITQVTTPSTANIYMARQQFTQESHKGYYDNFWFWHRALSQQEVDCLYNSGTGLRYSDL